MRLRTEVNVRLWHEQKPVRNTILTIILVFLPEIIFFIGGNIALYSDSIAKFLETHSFNLSDGDDDLLDDDGDDWLEATGSESTTEEESGAVTLGFGDLVYFHGEDTVSFWGNVHNKDSAKIDENGVVMFYGEEWKNASSGNLKSDGQLCLISPRPAPYAGSFTQVIDNGGNTASFPEILIDNPNNVYMSNDLIIEDTLFFNSGKLVLNGHDLHITNPHPDAIQGYNEDSYVVTGDSNQGGYLVRYGVGKDDVDFPIGRDSNSYTPVRMSNKGTADNYWVRAFKNVYENGDSGVQHNDHGTGQTWEIKEDVAGGSNLTLAMQHNQSDEGASFNAANQFIARYVGTKNNTSGDTISETEWDLVSFANTESGSSNGYITTGSAISGAVVTTRSGITDLGFFTKASYFEGGVLPVELLYFDAYANETYNTLKWSTAMEIDNYYFTLERSTDGENYTELDRVPGAGNSTDKTDYKYEDVQPFEITYYRLRQTDYDGTEEIIGHKVVRRDQQIARELVIYPNPCRGENLFVQLPEEIEEGDFIQVMDLGGAVIKRIELDPYGFDSVLRIQVTDMPMGMYLVQMSNRNVIRTKKLVIPER